jgi:septal ring factor EnvC (AmiA/AmiB activator)
MNCNDSVKARSIQQLRSEANELRAKQRDYKALQDQMIALEQAFSRLNEEKRSIEEEYSERVDANIRLIQTLRAEIDEQAMIYDERRH